MIRRRRLNFSPRLPQLGLGRLSVYWHKGIWQDALGHAARLNLGSIAREVALLWMLGILTGSFAALQWNQQYLSLPQFSLALSNLVQAMFGPEPISPYGEIGRLWIFAIALVSWLCLVSGTARLADLVSRVYQSSLTRRPRWASFLSHWLLTAVMVTVVNFILFWIGPEYGAAAITEDLKLKASEGSAIVPTWQTNFWYLVRWPLTLGLFGLSTAMFYRLSPQRWPRSAPLWSGVGLTTILSAIGTGAGWWTINMITSRVPAYGVLLVVAVVLLELIWLALVIPFGAQFNVSLIGRGNLLRIPAHAFPTTAPPPSFEAFKINRRQGDRFPPE